MNLDLYSFNLINSFVGKHSGLDFLAIFFAKYLSYIIVIILAVFAYAYNNINIFIFPVLCGVFSRFVINEVIYFFYKRKRPPELIKIKPLIKTPEHPSFPSGHTSFFLALSFALLPFSISLAIVFIVLSFLLSFFRIFVGVHWPSDILAGVIVGGISALLTYPAFLWILSNL